MPNGGRNIYKISRESAGLTQEKAAELLDISVRCLGAYESGERRVPDVTVIKMIEIYGAQYLAYQHLRTSAEVGRACLPDVELKGLPTAALTLLKELEDVVSCGKELISLTCDGKITEEERPRWEAILKELEELVSAGITVKYARNEGGAADG